MTDREVKVLLIEDNPVDAGFIQALLAETRSPWAVGMSFDVTRADRLATGLSHMANGNIGLVLLDLMLPDSRGLETLIRARSNSSEVPIVVLTSRDDETMAINALQQGAQDYLVKGSVTGHSLARAVRYAIERNQVERQLRKAVSLLSATLESTADGILVVDTDGTIVRSNQKLRDMWGLPDEVIGIKTHDEFLNVIRERLIAPDEFIASMELMQVRPDAESMDVINLKDGRVFEGYSPPQRISDGIVGRVWSFRDVTASKRADEELKRAFQWQEEIFEGSRDAVFISDFNSRFVFVNRAACELTAYSKEELLTMQIPDLHEDVDLEAYRQYHDSIMSGEEILSEAKVLRKDGTKIDVEFSNRRIDVSGVPYMHTAGREITERKVVEQALRESEERYRNLFENAPVGIYRTSPDGTILMGNPVLVRMLGYTSFAELAKRNIESEGFEPNYSREQFKEVMRTQGEVKGLEAAWTRHDGSVLFVRENARSVLSEAGELLCYEGTVEDITERKRAEEALRESEERFRLLIENSTDIVTIMDRNGLIKYVSPSASRLLGYTSDERIGHKPFEFVHPADLETVTNAYQALINGTQSIQHIEYRYRRRDGSWVVFDTTVKTLFDDSGVAGIAAYSRDITERKRMEDQLSRLAAIVESSSDAIISTSIDDFTVLSWNVGAERLYGYSVDEVRGKPVAILAPEDRQHEVAHIRERLVRGESIEDFETVRLRKDGASVHTSLTISPIKDAAGNVVASSAIARDITQRKRAEELLQRQSAFMKASMDGIAIYDRQGRHVYLNDAYLKLYSYDDPSCLIGQSWRSLFPEREVARFNKEVWPELLREGQWRGEASGNRRDGSACLQEISLTAIEGGGLVSVVRDITERKKAEEELKEFAAKLQRSNRELQEFAYVASHDLQEPLRKVLAFGDRLKARFAEALDSEGLDYLERMRNATRRMQTLINDLLTLSRVTTQARPFVQVHLDELAREVLSDLEIRVEQASGRVDIDHLPILEADPIQMHQLFQNLISNALKFHRSGVAPEVRITNRLLSEEGVQRGNSHNGEELCQIVVSDNGIGFDEKHLDRIFTVFQRLHGRGEYEGTGIGLAICRKIVERHGGQITASSRPGEGASFIVTLPLKQPRGEAGL